MIGRIAVKAGLLFLREVWKRSRVVAVRYLCRCADAPEVRLSNEVNRWSTPSVHTSWSVLRRSAAKDNLFKRFSLPLFVASKLYNKTFHTKIAIG